MRGTDIVTTLRTIITGIDENIVIIDSSGTILHATDSVLSLVNEKELKGKSIFGFIEGEAAKIKSWISGLSHSHFKEVKLKMLRDGQPFPARLRMAAWQGGKGEFVIMASIVDATFMERRKRDLLRKALTIEILSKSRKIRAGKLNDAIHEIIELSSKAVQVERVNAWLFDKEATRIECIGNYDATSHDLIPQESLPRIDMPQYFEYFETRKIILTSDAQNSHTTQELRDSYLIPNNIQAMMDIPVRIEGEIIGVICFEQVGHHREWTLQDQKFGLIAAQMVSLAVETFNRKKIQQELEQALRQQKQLMLESNHRIKNNLAVMASLMKMQLEKVHDDYHRGLMQDSLNRLYSIASLHDLLADTGASHRVQFAAYAGRIIKELQESLSDPSKPIQLIESIEKCELSGSLSVTLGLIINEAVTNAYKHAFTNSRIGVIRIALELNGHEAKLSVSDTGQGFSRLEQSSGQGMDIIQGLAEHIDGELITSTEAGSTITVQFRLK